MRIIDQSLHLLGEEAVKERVAENLQKWQGREPEEWTPEDLHTAWEIYHGLNLMEQYEDAARWFMGIGEHVHKLLDKTPEDEHTVEQFHEWGIISVRMFPESKRRFECLPLYTRLFEVVQGGPENQHFRLLELRLQLMRHFIFWQNSGGNPEDLPEETLAFLEDASESFEQAYEEMVEKAEEKGDVDTAVPLYRLAAQYYFFVDQPNDGMGCLKAALEDIDNTTGFTAPLRAALLLEIGKKFIEFKKPQIALKYLSEAMEIYQDAGEEFELQVAQVDSWMQSAKS